MLMGSEDAGQPGYVTADAGPIPLLARSWFDQRVAVKQHTRHGRAYRNEGLVVVKTSVVLFAEEWPAPIQPEPRQILVRFVDGIDVKLQHELLELVHNRHKKAERFEPITVVWDEPAHGWHPAERWSIVGHPEPIVLRRSAPLDQIDFRLIKPEPKKAKKPGKSRKPGYMRVE